MSFCLNASRLDVGLFQTTKNKNQTELHTKRVLPSVDRTRRIIQCISCSKLLGDIFFLFDVWWWSKSRIEYIEILSFLYPRDSRNWVFVDKIGLMFDKSKRNFKRMTLFHLHCALCSQVLNTKFGWAVAIRTEHLMLT